MTTFNDILPALKGGVSPRRMTYKQSLRFYQKQSLRFYQKQSLRFYQKQSLRFYQKQSLTLFAHFQSSILPASLRKLSRRVIPTLKGGVFLNAVINYHGLKPMVFCLQDWILASSTDLSPWFSQINSNKKIKRH